MRPVRMSTRRPRILGRRLSYAARSWNVLPGCARPFASELRAADRCRATAELLTTLPWWRRVPALPRLFHLRRLTLTRRLGKSAARRKAFSFVWVALFTPRIYSPSS
jgi:hypothetical protein